jgi:hypothetical protein
MSAFSKTTEDYAARNGGGDLLRDAEEHRQQAIELRQEGRLDPPEWRPELFARYRHGLVHHRLRRLAQSGPGVGSSRRRNSGASRNARVTGSTVTDGCASKKSDWITSAGRGFP